MLEKGEIDLMSDVSYTPERAERMLYPSFPMGSEEYYLFVSPSNREILPTDFSTQNGKRIGVNKNSVQATYRTFAKKEHVIVAVNEGNPNYDAFLLENFPGWTRIYYPTTLDCLRAVSEGVADCVLISNYRYNNIARLCEKYRLVTFATGVEIDYSLLAAALHHGQSEYARDLLQRPDLLEGAVRRRRGH